MSLSESLVLFLQFVFCITYVLEIRYAYTKDKQNEFTSYNIIKTPSISTKRKITSDLNSLNTEKGGNVGNGGHNRYLNKR
jgi:hypothetical protein